MAGKQALPQTAAIYCRVSTRAQGEEGTSLASQETACRAYAERLGYTVGAVYREIHSGADLFGRDQMTALRDSVRRREVGIVIAYALDRLARKQVHQGLIYAEAEHAGVPIDLVTEKLEDTPEGRLLLSVKSYTAEVEREKIRERSIRGKRTRLMTGKLHNHSADLYGYRRDKEAGVRIMHAPEAAIVRRIFHALVDDGQSVRGIAAALNDDDVPAPSTGKRTFKDGRLSRWNPSTLYRMLTEPAYKGETVLWRHRGRADGKMWEYRDESEWIRLPEGTTPAIVSAELWQSAQSRLSSSTAATTRNQKRQYLLRGLIYCSVCGQRMYAESEHGRPVYRCSSRDRGAHTACGGARVNGAAIEAWAWEEIATILRNPETIAAEVERRRQSGEADDLTSTRDLAAAMLAKIEKQLARLVRRYADADDDNFPWEMVEREIARLESERRTAQAALAEIEQRIEAQASSIVRLDGLRAYCDTVSANLEHPDFAMKRDAVEALIERIDANGRDWQLTGSIPNGTQTGVVSTTSS